MADLRLDIKDMANWPAPVQLGALLGVMAVVVALGWFSVWKGQFEEIEVARQTEEQLKTDYRDRAQKALNLKAYEEQLAEISTTLDVLLKQLPKKSEMDALLTEINYAGVGRGLRFDLFKPGSEMLDAEMAELPIEIKLTGNYHDLAAFASDVSKLSRIVTLSNVYLKTPDAQKTGDGLVSLEAVAKTYRYLDEEEKISAKQQGANKGGVK